MPNKNNQLKNTTALLFLAIILVALPLHLRYSHNNPTMPGTETYYHARMAIEILNGIPEIDEQIVNGRNYAPTPYHFVLAGTYSLIGPAAFTVIPALFALLSYLLLWNYLSKKVNQQIQPWILLCYALSPPFITTAFLNTPLSFNITLLLAGAILLQKSQLYALPLMLLAGISSLSATITAITITTYESIRTKKIQTLTLVLLFTILAINKYPPAITTERTITTYISDLGGQYGISIFTLLLAIVGAATLWPNKTKKYSIYALLAIFTITTILIPETLAYTNILICILAGTALSKLSQRKWKLTYLRQAALLVLFCGLLFSAISHSVQISDTHPTYNIMKALEFTPSTILTAEKYGFWVEFSRHKAVIDPYEKTITETQKWHADTIFKQIELEKAQQLLKQYNITHILITQEMQQGLIWEREEQGLDFVVKNSETFKKIETGTNVDLWRVR